jgi:hypothetical protein
MLMEPGVKDLERRYPGTARAANVERAAALGADASFDGVVHLNFRVRRVGDPPGEPGDRRPAEHQTGGAAW